jgi:hypothetical protein
MPGALPTSAVQPVFQVVLALLWYPAVAPQFKDSFKEDLDWRVIYQGLVASGVKQVYAAEAFAKSKRWVSFVAAQHLGSQVRPQGLVAVAVVDCCTSVPTVQTVPTVRTVQMQLTWPVFLSHERPA